MKKRIKWNPRFITSLFIAFMCTLNCMAQNVIKGSVNDGSGEPLPGVSVAVKGTNLGTITDIDGHFTLLNVPNSAKILQISYIGMKTESVPVQPTVRVILKSDTQLMDEVVTGLPNQAS